MNRASSATRVQVERIDVEPFVAPRQDVDFQDIEGEVFFETANAIDAVADFQRDFTFADLRFDFFRCGGNGRGDRRFLAASPPLIGVVPSPADGS